MKLAAVLAALLFAACVAWGGEPAGPVPLHSRIVGEWRSLVVRPGDSLASIAAEHGFDVRLMLRANALDDPDTLIPGNALTLDTRRIVPELTDNGIVLDVAAGMLYLFDGGRMAARFPAGFGSPSRPTPEGEFSVLLVERMPEWTFPPSPRAEGQREAAAWALKALPEPPESLGPAWIQLSRWGFGIHASPFGEEVGGHGGSYQTRLSPADMEALLRATRPGARVVSFYAPVRLALTPDGGIWLEAHKDVYGRGLPEVAEVLDALGEAAASVDAERAARAIELALGAPLRIGTLRASRGAAAASGLADARAELRCMDCPPGELRRITLRLEAFTGLSLEGEFPLEVRDEAGRIVSSPPAFSGVNPTMRPGESRHFVWECTDGEGQPLPPGSYTVLALFKTASGRPGTVSLPIWLGK